MDLETKFSYKIDCMLNYFNREEMLCFFEESKSISPNSVFRFLEELFNAPVYNCKSIKLVKNIQFILNHIDKEFEHPLKQIVFTAGICKINNSPLPIKKVISYLNQIRQYKEYFSALNIVKSSSRRNNSYFINVIEAIYNSVLNEWD